MSSRLPRLAIRNVGRNRRRSLITGVTIVFGVAMVLLVRGFTGGMAKLMVDDVVLGRVGAIQVHRAGYVDNVDSVPTRLNLPYDEALRAKMAAVPHVTGVTGRITFNGLVSNGAQQTMFIGRGLDLSHELEACPRAKTLIAKGAPLEPADGTAVTLVGSELGESFKLSPGQMLTLQSTSPSGRANALDLTVKGLTTSTFPFENKRVVTLPLETAQQLVGLEGRVTEYVVAVDDLAALDDTANALRATLGPDFEVHTWRELQPFVRDLINRQNFVLGAIAFVLFVIVLTGIVNTMLMSVFERVREIGTLLAVGVRRRQVMQMFLVEAAVIGAVGGLLGALVGRAALFAFAAKGIVFKLSGVSGANVLRPFATNGFTAMAVAVAVVGAIAAALWPAFRASRLNPVEALRQ
ncbi:MAG: ABC transporter permease [Myxococcaceae bacterium]|jgi:putative ABC transport system permease protein|nr:ABC transporter permease [Myxococcaceae bacterium]